MEFNYTENQRRAFLTIDRNLQIVACAGSGKTQVLAQRVVEILRGNGDDGAQPANIVAFTFTERAGAELKARIVELVRDDLGDITGMAEMYVGTIHGYCLQLLQSQIPKYFKYSVLNEIQTRLLVDRASRKTGLGDLGLTRWKDSARYLSALDILREAELDSDVLDGHPALEALSKYQGYLDEKRSLDYSEIVCRAVSELSSNVVLRESIASRLRYLIIDEYQDVNPLQERLIRLLHELGANVCVVGDDDQTIYQWRGSSVENILQFADRYPDVATIPIERNFRSSEGVVEAARGVIENNDPDRLEKRMHSHGVQSYERGDILCLEFNSIDEEARWIATKAKAMLGTPFADKPGGPPRGLAESDIAVLLRSVRRNGEAIVTALRREGLNVVVGGMTGLFDTPEAQAAVAIFDFMVGRVTKSALRDAWLGADLGVDPRALRSAIATLGQQRRWGESRRYWTYNLQRTFLGFLEEAGLREEDIPGKDRGEIVYYNLGKFSEVISDYEQIHFHSEPKRKYEWFAEFLQRQAPDYYPEGWQDRGYARPNAVQVMTVHQAKGMEWPVVFVPCLIRNRFPSKKHGGPSVWHIIPKEGVRDADRFDGSVEDERRLFYVALTRSKKFLYCSWAPIPANQLYRKASQFVAELTASDMVLTKEPKRSLPKKLPSTSRHSVLNVTFSFSELKYLFECPYEFKLRFMYGFNPPLHEALGYGKSLHDALAEVHKRALEGDIPGRAEAAELVERHLHVPFAYPELRAALQESGTKAVKRYIKSNAQVLDKVEHVEQVVELNLGDGLVVNGRIDLIRRTDTREIVIIDFKSTERAQQEEVTRMQLHVYAIGYRELTGRSADLIEIYNLDHGGSVRETVDAALETRTVSAINDAGTAVRANRLRPLPEWEKTCAVCDVSGICRTSPQASA